MNKGVQIYTVRDCIGTKEAYYEALRKIRDMGYNCVQAYPTADVDEMELLAMLKDLELRDCSVGGDLDAIDQDPSLVAGIVEKAHLYGVNEVSIGTLRKEWRECEEGYHKFAEQVNRVGGLLAKEGLHLMYHSHALEFFALGGGLKGMDIILGETDPDALHFCLDTHWLTAGGVSVVEWIQKVKGRMSVVHFKDYAIVGGAVKIEEVHKQFAEIGEGSLNWPAIIDACRDIGVEYYIVEQDICKGDPFESLAISSRNLTRFGITA